jgi:hypothetical protein
MRTLTTLKYNGTQGDFLRRYMSSRRGNFWNSAGSLLERLAPEEDCLEMRLELVMSIDCCLRQRQMI